MNLSLPGILDVALGLILVYLTLSIFASEIQEIITAWLQLRARHLKKSIYRLFGGTRNSQQLERQLRGIKEENQVRTTEQKKAFSEEEKIINLVNTLYQHPAILSTTQSTLGISANDDISATLYGPSYITAEDFSEALLDILYRDFQWPPEVTLKTIMEDLKPKDPQSIIPPTSEPTVGKKSNNPAQDFYCIRSIKRVYEAAEVADKWYRKRMPDKSDLELFKFSLQDWFNKSQYHASGTYKRNSKYLLFLIGLVATVFLNANTFHIAQNLLTKPEGNLDIATISNEIIQGCDTEAGLDAKSDKCKEEIHKVNQIINDVQVSNLPIGWSLDSLNANSLGLYFNNFTQKPFNSSLHLIYQLVGWTVSALAIMMGASFWFDVLKRFVNIRNTVAPPKSASTSRLESESQET